MELNEILEISILLDYYRNLLSDKQKEYLVEHFEDDLSLTEIGKKHDISRQAAYDNVKRGIKTLREYEDKIGCYRRDRELLSELEDLKENFTKGRLEEIIEKNF